MPSFGVVRRATWLHSGAGELTEFAAELQAELATGILVAHNARFDLSFLEADACTRGTQLAAPTRWLCTASFGARSSLDVVAARFGVTPTARHTAAGDAETLSRTLARMTVAAEEWGLDTVSGLVVVSGSPETAATSGEAGWPALVRGLDRVVPSPFVTGAQRSAVRRLVVQHGKRGPPTPSALSSVTDELRELGLSAIAVETLLGESGVPDPSDTSRTESHV